MIRIAPSSPVLISCVLLLSGCGGSSSGGNAEQPAPDLAGVINIESGTRVDTDTADDIFFQEEVDNGTPGLAQPLPSGATVGGYLSFSFGTYGHTSFFAFFEDNVDFYAAELAPGDRVTAQVFLSPEEVVPQSPPDRTLRILQQPPGGDPVEIDGDTATDDLLPLMVTLPDDAEPGSYLIEVSTTGGIPFRYVLNLADQASTSVMNTRYTDPSFMVDEAIVSFESAPGGNAMAAMAVSDRRNLGRGAWLMRRDGARNLATLSASQVQDARKDTLDWIRGLRDQSGVAAAEPNYLYTSQQVLPDDDPLYNRQWNLSLTRAPMAWQAAPNVGTGIGIAVLDTGMFSTSPESGGNWHPDLAANVQLIPGEIMDYVAGDLDIDAEDSGQRDTNPADPGDGNTRSSNFHGTHVAGIAAAVDNSAGIVGMAPDATIYPVRVLGRDGVGSSADLIDALNWVASRNEIDVINLSLGGLGPSSQLKAAIDAAWNGGNGKLVVAAAGNQASDEPTYPAAYDNVIGVGAVDGAGNRASYSNVGASVDVVAPGGDGNRDANLDGAADLIISTWGRDENGDFQAGYAGLQGTSMAAPHVAGIYALMKGELDTLTPGDFRNLLRSGALTNEVGPAFEYGAGLINALAAMDAALDGNFPVTLGASPSALQFNSAVLSAEIVFSVYPEGETVAITDASTSADWLIPGSIPTEPPLSLTVSVDPSGLEDNQRYTTELVIAYDPDNGDPRLLTIPVSLRLGTSPDERDAGRHFVLLVSTDDGRSTIEQAVVTASGGQYRFSFDQVEPGEYFLVAGTDMDNNGLICENGEACAEYPVNGLPEKIVIGDEPLGGVRLSTSFRRPTIEALGGLPRVGFEGYRLKPDDGKEQGDEPVRRLENNR